MYKFSFNINQNDIFDSSMNTIKSKSTFLIDIIFTFAAIFITIYNLITKKFFILTLFQKMLLIFSILLFPVIQPAIIYLKSIIHASKIKDYNITMEFYDDKLVISSDKESSEVKYENIFNFIKYKNMIVVMYDAIHGQIMPNRIFNDNKEEFFNYVSSRIKYAREKQNET